MIKPHTVICLDNDVKQYLNVFLERYDQNKGPFRKLFFDHLAIKKLRKLKYYSNNDNWSYCTYASLVDVLLYKFSINDKGEAHHIFLEMRSYLSKIFYKKGMENSKCKGENLEYKYGNRIYNWLDAIQYLKYCKMLDHSYTNEVNSKIQKLQEIIYEINPFFLDYNIRECIKKRKAMMIKRIPIILTKQNVVESLAYTDEERAEYYRRYSNISTPTKISTYDTPEKMAQKLRTRLEKYKKKYDEYLKNIEKYNNIAKNANSCIPGNFHVQKLGRAYYDEAQRIKTNNYNTKTSLDFEEKELSKEIEYFKLNYPGYW